MNLFEYLGEKKLNELIIPNPYDSAGKIDVTKGPIASRFLGLLGQEFKLSEKTALKQSNTTIGTLYGGIYKIVRVQPDFATVAITDVIVGRMMFWNDKKKNLVTPLAAITGQQAGICVCKLTSANAKGDLIVICVEGEVEFLMGTITKTTVAVGDPVVFAVASNLAVGDVLADATGWTNVQLGVRVGKMISALGTGGDGLVARIYYDNATKNPDDGVI